MTGLHGVGGGDMFFVTKFISQKVKVSPGTYLNTKCTRKYSVCGIKLETKVIKVCIKLRF